MTRKNWRCGIMAAWSSAVVLLYPGRLPAAEPAPAGLFELPGIAHLPLQTEVLSEKTVDGVKTLEFYLNGAPFNGQPTRIYAFYSRPEKPGKYPAVVELHGAGLATLSPETGINYARNQFCCFTLDWCGPAKDRTPPRQPPFSEVATRGSMCAPPRQADGTAIKGKPWHIFGAEEDAQRNGVLFVRRAVQFLQSREEVDPQRLCISGMSAGALLTLNVLGNEPAFRAAAVKYGCGFVTMPGYRLGGYFVPLTLCPKEEQEQWAALFDPALRFDRVKADVLLLSGTDDHFFWMPMVLKSYRALPVPKRLLMLPNDNHSQVGNWEIPLRYFKAVLGLAPQWPTVELPSAVKKETVLALAVKASGATATAKASFWVKRMPLASFKFKRDLKTPVGSIEPWREVTAALADGVWRAEIPAPADGEQIVLYATVEDTQGVRCSSDTLEIPDYPQWRGVIPPPAIAK